MTDGLFIGLMSGTSMDGIDVALVSIKSDRITLVATHQHSWSEALQHRLQQTARDGRCSLSELGQLDAACGETFAQAALALLAHNNIEPNRISAIGSHGQTLCHDPLADFPFSLQIGDPNRIAELTGITTVADFRRRDIAAGGQGAPLVPAFHHALFTNNTPTAILNIGGIANLTLLADSPDGTRGFDTGPGNCLMDQWIQQHRGNRFDRDGAWGASGRPHAALLEALQADPYFQLPPPKSTGTEYFSMPWLEDRFPGINELPANDVQASLQALSAQTIAAALVQQAPQTEQLLVCGGGAHNRHLMQLLAQALPQSRVRSTKEVGVDPDWIEAMAFAWLAARTLSGETGNIPGVTGARHAVTLGGVYPAQVSGD